MKAREKWGEEYEKLSDAALTALIVTMLGLINTYGKIGAADAKALQESFDKKFKQFIFQLLQTQREEIYQELKDQFRKYHDIYPGANFYDFMGILSGVFSLTSNKEGEE